ncbi:unnamed protein product [marine sediment metagenome]|uniref:LysM domain-containing protein n=1 Tax=marine sediment metagenome TaxID=412755 RepID=X1NXI7_9ZZZZ
MNIKKIFLYILIIIVIFLVIVAFYSNRYKFTGLNTIKYTKIILKNETNVNDLAVKYSSSETKAKFVSEIKKINNIDSSEYILGNVTIIIPIIEAK